MSDHRRRTTPRSGAVSVVEPATPPGAGGASSSGTRRRAAAAASVDVLPGGPRGRRAAREQQRRSRSRRRGLLTAAAAVLAVVTAVVAVVVTRGGGGGTPVGDGSGRTQHTVLLQVAPTGGPSLAAALLAADSAGKDGAAVLVPSRLIVDVPGATSMPFGRARTVSESAAADSLSDAMGVLVDGTWTLTPSGLARLVDGVGGVTVDVDSAVTRRGPGGATVVVVPKGPGQHLDGGQAAAYATWRAGNEPEQSQLARFSAVLSATLAALPSDSGDVAHLVDRLGDSSTASWHADRLASFLTTLGGAVGGDNAVFRVLPVTTIDTGGPQPAYGIDQRAVAALVDSTLAGSKPPTRPGGPVRVLVENGVGTPGLGLSAREKLVGQGFTFVSGGNADRFGYDTSLVLVPDAGATSVQRGRDVAAALKLPQSAVKISGQGQSIADVVVILGADYKP